jgi:catechol 2,3-dioxygenase
MPELGHAVLYVSNLQKSLSFYRDLVGLEVQGLIFNDRAAVLSGGGTHHELMLIEVGAAPGPLQGKRLGLYHLGWKVGDNLSILKQLHKQLRDANYPIKGLSDHTISQSIYLHDPDGNEIELYVDNPEYDWRSRSDWMETPVKPLNLDAD